jgi:DNA helicase INO80
MDVYVDPSPLQRQLYKSLRANISMAELMDRATDDSQEGVQSLMNIVMQLRKVRPSF